MLHRTLALAALLVAAASFCPAQTVRQERVVVSGDAEVVTVEGSVRGYETVQYQVGAAAGDTMTLELSTENQGAYFDVFGPGVQPGDGVPLFSGARGGRAYRGMLGEAGDYVVQVSLSRAAARQSETADYSLAVGLTGGEAGTAVPAPAAAAPAPAARAAASGQLPCSAAGAPLAPCRYRVTGGSGTATVSVALATGGERSITFVGGQPVTSNRAGALIAVSRQGGASLVSIGDERYAVPDSVARGR